MLRANVRTFVQKSIPVPLLCESDVKEVLVDVTDPITGEQISQRKEMTSIVRQLPNDKLVSNEPADIYSIENMQKVGILPVTCGDGGYIRTNLDNLTDVENAAVDLLDASEPSPVVNTETVEPAPAKTE